MGATLETLRKYIRAEVNDPAPLRKLSTLTLTHDGATDNEAFFQDASHNFVTLGVIVGDVIYNTSDGGSLAVIRGFANGGGTNDKLMVSSIEGGTDNQYDTGDVVQIYDRHAQRGLDGTRWTDTEVEDALAQAQKLVALRFGGVEKTYHDEDIKVMSKIDIVGASGTMVAGETVTGGNEGHTAVVEYVGDTFIVIRDFVTKFSITGGGSLIVGETVTGATSGVTAIVVLDGTNTLQVKNPSGTFTNGETLTGGTTGTPGIVMNDSGYSSGLFAANEILTGGTSSATGKVKEAYAANNYYIGQDYPTDLKNVIDIRWWNSSMWEPLIRDHIQEYDVRSRSTGDPRVVAVFENKIWLWPNNSREQYNAIQLRYMAWDATLSADTDTTLFDNRMERLIVLEGAKILAGQVNEEQLWQRIVNELQLVEEAVDSSGDNEVSRVRQEINWDSGYGDDGAFL